MSGSDFSGSGMGGATGGAANYSNITARATAQAAPALLSAVRLRPFTRLLDVACGPGYVAGAASALGVSALGVDISSEMVAVARARQLNADFEIGDAQALPHGEQEFDSVACNFGVFHLDDPEAALREAWRVLRPGGRYAFSQWLGPEESAFFAAPRAALAELGAAGPDAAFRAAFRFSDRALCRRAMQEAGFVDVVIDEAPIEYRAPAADFLGVLRMVAAALTRELLALVEPEALGAALDRAVAAHRRGGEFRVPMPAIIVSGARPEATAS